MGVPLHLAQIVLLISLLAACSAPSTPPQLATSTPLPLSPEPSLPPEPTMETRRILAAGQWNDLFYHPQLEKVVLVNGGPDRGKPAGDPLELWAWDGGEWSLLSADPDGPRWRNFAGSSFDTKRNVLVIYGGVQSGDDRLEETWEWDGETWTEFSMPGPGYREGALMAFDEVRGKTVLFGGANENFEMMGDTWEWDGSQWTQVSTTGPAPRFPISMVYDTAREKILLFGGHVVSGNEAVNFNDLWEWDGTIWREHVVTGDKPTVRNVAEMVFHPASERVMLFGGGENSLFLSDLWAWDGTAWTQVAKSGAPARSGMNGAYDARGKLVAFGGVEKPGGKAITDTWEWDGQKWTCVWGCN